MEHHLSYFATASGDAAKWHTPRPGVENPLGSKRSREGFQMELYIFSIGVFRWGKSPTIPQTLGQMLEKIWMSSAQGGVWMYLRLEFGMLRYCNTDVS